MLRVRGDVLGFAVLRGCRALPALAIAVGNNCS